MLLHYVLLGLFFLNHTFSSSLVLKLFICMRSLKKKNTSVHDDEKEVINFFEIALLFKSCS